ncbi:MAG: SOS response-associated peptidase [Actinomycetota bacterium]|nr:SOS response-associated peptidase [Actinomycetota bacterium]
MCGRYASSRSPEDLVEEFEVDRVAGEPPPASYNIAPTDPVVSVLERAPRKEPEADAERVLRVLRWGLVPSWAKDPSIGSRMINARVETVHEKPAFRRPFAARRCLLPADGYYEWYTFDRPAREGGRRATTRKQPFFIRPRDGGVLAMAGLYELWRDPAAAEGADPWLWTCTVITTTAEDELGRIHDRMPMIVERERYDAWLDPANDDPDALRALLVPAAPGRLEAYAVSTEVNSVRNDGPQLVAPLPTEGEPAENAIEGGADRAALF